MSTDLQESPARTEPNEPPKFVVRYGSMRHLGEFTSKWQHTIVRGDDVIVRSDRGVEFGIVLCEATDKTNGYLGNNVRTGRILRLASDEDRRSLSYSGKLGGLCQRSQQCGLERWCCLSWGD